MRFISSLTWIQKGVSRTPTRIKLEQDEMKKLFSEIAASNEHTNEDEEDDEENEVEEQEDQAENEKGSENEESKINRKYKLDDYDQEGFYTL
jgi:hypothetical protein